MVLRNKKNQLFIFESTSNDGVGLTTWKDMIRYEWYKSTEKYICNKLGLLGEGLISNCKIGILKLFKDLWQNILEKISKLLWINYLCLILP